MKKIVSDSLQILTWLICIPSAWLSVVALSFFHGGSSWAGVGLLLLLYYYLPFCLLCCILPLAYLVIRYKAARDVKSLKIAMFSTGALVVSSGLALWLAPHGNGC